MFSKMLHAGRSWRLSCAVVSDLDTRPGSILRVSKELSLVAEIVETQEKIDKFLPVLIK
jgi:PII-like signaling protein